MSLAAFYRETNPPTEAERRKWSKPCRTKYTHPAFVGQHNVVTIYDHGKPVGRRCVSCDAKTDTLR